MFHNIFRFVEVLIFWWPKYFDSSDLWELFPFDIFVHKFVHNFFGFKVIRDGFWSENSYSNTYGILRSCHILDFSVWGFIEHSNKSCFPWHDDCISEDVVDLVEHSLIFEMNVISLVFFIDFPCIKDGFKNKGVFLFDWGSEVILIELKNDLFF